MKELGLAIEGGVLLGCIWGLLVIALAVLTCHIIRGWHVWRKKRKAAAMSMLAVAAIIIGGTKPPTVNVTWDDYFTAPKSATVDTNDLRHIDFAWDLAHGVPSFATATLSAVPATNGELTAITTVPMTNRALSVIMPTDATNYLYWMECSFIPDAPVVTNGVYHLRCVGGDDVWVPIGITIYNDGRQISPPESYLYDLTD